MQLNIPVLKLSVNVRAELGDQTILIVIQDHGIGIPQADQARVFERFFRADNAIRTATEGTGLGLLIAKQIIDAHNGTIWISSEENNGTNFFITLPKK